MLSSGQPPTDAMRQIHSNPLKDAYLRDETLGQIQVVSPSFSFVQFHNFLHGNSEQLLQG